MVLYRLNFGSDILKVSEITGIAGSIKRHETQLRGVLLNQIIDFIERDTKERINRRHYNVVESIRIHKSTIGKPEIVITLNPAMLNHKDIFGTISISHDGNEYFALCLFVFNIT